jgi:homoserine dehydrogenase
MKKIKVGLLGFGTVGSGIWKVLEENREEISEKCGKQIEISKILVRDLNKARDAEAPEELFTLNPDEVLEDDSIEIIIEVMGGINPAKDYILKAIRQKKHIVTANKQLIATHGSEISKEASENNVKLHYEASVAGGIPIINTIKESLTANKIEEIVGIVNGTTNYILTKMSKYKSEFSSVLKEAQDMGYAEAAPTADVEGYDAAYKIAILSSLAFRTEVDINDIFREGISRITPVDIEYAREMGYVIKLLAIGKNKSDHLEIRVHPTLIPEPHPLAAVNDCFNGIFVKGNAVGSLMFYGRGAGDLPTASAVVADVISVVCGEISGKKELSVKSNVASKKVMPIDELESEYYIRLIVKDKPGVLGNISSVFGSNGISLSSVIQKGTKEEEASLVFVTHLASESNVKKALEHINSLPETHELANLIRIEKFGVQ